MENIKAVVFDFDGTLTHKNDNVWKSIYESIGYPTDKNSSYHKSFVDFLADKFDYEYWVVINENDFKDGKLTKEMFYDIVNRTILIDGIKETVETLKSKNIKLYILSGNFVELISHSLGELSSYFEEISANKIEFDKNGYISHLTATKFDFYGKPDFLTKISREQNIPPSQICFVGNGINDIFAHKSGAQTICINPENDCHKTEGAWTHVIEKSSNLTDILKFIN